MIKDFRCNCSLTSTHQWSSRGVGSIVLWYLGMIRDASKSILVMRNQVDQPPNHASPVPDIIKALFNTYDEPKSRKRSSRPSLEDDLQKQSDDNKENGASCSGKPTRARKISRSSSSQEEKRQTCTGEAATMRLRSLSARPTTAEVFQYPSPRKQSQNYPLPSGQTHYVYF